MSCSGAVRFPAEPLSPTCTLLTVRPPLQAWLDAAGLHITTQKCLGCAESPQCEPLPWVPLQVRSERGRLDLVTDAQGHAELPLTALPAETFPYRKPLLEVVLGQQAPLAIQASAQAGALLVIARGSLDDLDAWLAIHGVGSDDGRVTQARKDRWAADRAEQDRLLQTAQAALVQDDFAGAQQAIEACTRLAYGPSPACEALQQHIIDTFVTEQVEAVRNALQEQRFDAAALAVWRCDLAARNDVRCDGLRQAVLQGRVDFAVDNGQKALERRDFSMAGIFVERCQALAPADRGCLLLADQVSAQYQELVQLQVGALVRRAQALERRNALQAALAWQQCQTLVPQETRCIDGLLRTQKRVVQGANQTIHKAISRRAWKQALAAWSACRLLAPEQCDREPLRTALRTLGQSCAAVCHGQAACVQPCENL